MGRWKRRIGLSLVIFGVVMGLTGLGMYVSPTKGATAADAPGQVVLGFVFIIPGAVIYWLGRLNRAAEENHQALIGYLKARSRLVLSDAAAYLGVPVMEAQRRIDTAISRREVDLVFSQTSEEYFHRAAIEQAQGRIISTCANCGASVREQAILPGEMPLCTFCGASLVRDP